MIRAGSLFLVIAISTIIGLLSAALILVSFYQREIAIDDNNTEAVRVNTLSGINLILGWKDLHPSELDTAFDLFGQGNDSIHLQIKNWGLFNVGIVQATKKRWSKQSLFLFGNLPTDELQDVLYLSDLKRPLTIVGETKITGDAALPDAGIHAGYIDDKNYKNDSLLYGKSLQSKNQLPKLNFKWLRFFSDLLTKKDSNLLKKYSSNLLTDSNFRSFKDSTFYVMSTKPEKFENLRAGGNILIFSEKELQLDSTSDLNQIILVAPVIKIKGHFKGIVQAFASDSLIVGKNCVLNYPSALVLLKDSSNKSQPLLSVGERTDLKGIIISFCINQDLNLSLVNLDKETNIQGIVYVNGFLQISGQITGSTLTDHFLYKSPSTIYENHLVDAILNRKKLSTHYVGTGVIQTQQSRKSIVQWLD